MNQKPAINVTPLIDVLLVLLIIFMVISPLKPSAFKAQLPAEPVEQSFVASHPHALIVTLNTDKSLKIDRKDGFGSIENPQKLIDELSRIFRERKENRVYAQHLAARTDLTEDERILKAVFIKAPRDFDYGSVVKVIDAAKISGADPISLQIDSLD